MIQPDSKLSYTIAEAAEACCVPVYTIRTAIRNFEITPHKIGRHSVLTRDDLLAWITRQPRFTPTRERNVT